MKPSWWRGFKILTILFPTLAVSQVHVSQLNEPPPLCGTWKMVSRKVNDGSKGPKSLTYAISLKGKTVEIISNRDDKKYKIEYVVDGEEHIFEVLPMDDILAKAHWDAGALVRNVSMIMRHL